MDSYRSNLRTTLLALLLASSLLLPGGATAAGPSAADLVSPDASADCSIWWNEVLHDTFDADYRSVTGPATPGTTVKLRLRVADHDITGARVRVWDDRTNTETYYPMSWDGSYYPDDTTYDWWFADVFVGGQPTVLYYFFEINDAPGWCTADQDFYTDDDPKFYGGGYGTMRDDYNDGNSFQLTVYDPSFDVPAWMQSGVVYQIFPDRFRDGDGTNDPAAGRFSYDRAGGAIVRSQYGGANGSGDWNFTICDPRSSYSPSCANYYGDNFYGGDLRGVIQKIDDGYFDNLGVSVLYLNPIFRSPSNHKYDTADYMVIDPDFGTLADFQELATKAQAHGIRLVLDGVFNHTSSDSKYFDRYSRYDGAGNLTSPSGPGTDDNSAACESAGSLYRNWYYIPDIGTPGNQPADRCDADDGDDTAGPWTLTYDAWYGYGSLPKLQANTAAVRSLIWSNGTNSVGPYWVSQGADGWRFDVGGDVDPGLTNDPANDYWEGFRAAVRAVDPQALTLGEEWGDASAWLLGNEWDSVMNYRFRSTLLSWLFTGCSGNGCTGGTKFQENDSNDASSSGPIQAISPSQFNARLRSIAEDYPPMAFQAMMNLEGSHDTNRLRFLLKKVNNDDDGAAVQRMKEWWLFSFTYPGAPTLYYGDEIGLNHDGVWDDSTWQDDPYNRVPFPWPDASGNTYSYDPTAAGAGLQAFARHMASLYWSYPALQDGAVQHGLIIDDANKLYGYARTNDSQTALIVLNRDSSAHTATFSGLNAAPYNLPDGTELVDGLAGDLSTVYTVAGGSVSVLAPSNWGVVLLERAKIDVPAAAPSLSGSQVGSTVTLSWPTVTGDLGGGRELVTAYEVHRSTTASFTPDDTTLHATVSPSDPPFRFGSSDGDFTWSETVAEAAARPAQPNADYYYRICTRNAAGVANRSGCPSIAPLAVTLASFQAQPESGHVLVTWETVSEVANTGFNLYRSPSPKDPGDLLAFLPSQAPGSTAGASYSYQDWTATTGQSYWYWLEDVDTSGTTTLHGPVSVVYQARTIPGALGRIPGQSRALGRCHAIRREAVR